MRALFTLATAGAVSVSWWESPTFGMAVVSVLVAAASWLKASQNKMDAETSIDKLRKEYDEEIAKLQRENDNLRRLVTSFRSRFVLRIIQNIDRRALEIKKGIRDSTSQQQAEEVVDRELRAVQSEIDLLVSDYENDIAINRN